MKTSYFANLRNVATPLSISRWSPRWYEGPVCLDLAPPVDLLRAAKAGVIDDIDYTEVYLSEVLDRLDARETYDGLIRRYGEDVTLLCYEKPGDFCHRRIVATWIEMRLGIVVPEVAVRLPASVLAAFR